MNSNRSEPDLSTHQKSFVLNSETRRLRFSFLAPLLAAITFIVAAMVIVNYTYHQRQLESGVVQMRTSAAKLYEESVQQNIRALHMVMDVLERDDSLRNALERKDRKLLLMQSAPVFEELKRNYGISHFYFTGTDRVNLLRVHQPGRYGDVIDRLTMLNAEQSGALSHGIELGPMGLLTLRLVSPWYDTRTRKLVGYVELGMEIDNILSNVQNLFGVEAFVLIQKKYLERKGWEAGMRVMGRTPNWDQFHDAVLSVQGKKELPVAVEEIFSNPDIVHTSHTIELDCGGRPCQAMPLSLTDVAGQDVAQMVLMTDVSRQVTSAQRAVMVGGIVSIVSGLVLFIFFYWLVGRIGQRIERDERKLHELASRDGLTGLYNHRMFYSMLEDEIARCKRYHRPITLLLIDIDHFKRINDTYGHVAGDRILEGLSRVLENGVRSEDKVCRYGGEEMTVILPETDSTAALHTAERLRASVEATLFKDDKEQEIMITVSIGVAELPKQVDSLQDLVHASDTALYMAKDSGRNRVCLFEGFSDVDAEQEAPSPN